jgi:hypothetical protein
MWSEWGTHFQYLRGSLTHPTTLVPHLFYASDKCGGYLVYAQLTTLNGLNSGLIDARSIHRQAIVC